MALSTGTNNADPKVWGGVFVLRPNNSVAAVGAMFGRRLKLERDMVDAGRL